VLCIGAVIIYRKKYPKLERPYKVWGGIPTIILTIILFGILLVNELVSDPKAAVTGLIVPAIGLVVYAYFRKKNGGQDYKGEGIE
jgi:APA family basic amino acid/polyamine antiporter